MSERTPERGGYANGYKLKRLDTVAVGGVNVQRRSTSHLTNGDFTGVWLDAEIKISMDGKGRWIDNRFPSRRLKVNACR